ncbi:MAG: LysR family transcriptional regulator [Bacteriovoracia bacterium]
MNLHRLRYFYDSARLGSTTEAARANFITQSAVSQAIRALEDDLNGQLIYHRKNSFELTPTGQVAYRECQSIFGAIDNFRATLSKTAEKVSGQLAIAATNSIALTALATPLAKLTQRHPELSLQLKLGNSDQVKDHLRRREAELGFLLEDDDLSEFDATAIREGRFQIVASPKFKARRPLEGVIITRPHKVEVRHLQKQFEKAFGKPLVFPMEVFSWELIRQLCLDGAGPGYLPDYLIRQELASGKLKVLHPELKPWKYKLLAIRLKGRVPSRNAGALLDAVR